MTSCLALLSATTPALSLPVDARETGIQIAQNEREPVAQIDPDRPILIEVVNAGGVPITCRLTQPATDDRVVAPGSSVTFGSATTSYLPVPIYFLAYPSEQNIGLSLYALVDDNVIQVVVAESFSDMPGTTAMSIDANGSIYVY